MTKTEFTQKLADGNNLAKNEAERLVNAFLDSVEDALYRDRRLLLKDFGTFSVRARKAREAKNPRTGEIIHIDKINTVHFKASKTLVELLN